MIKKMQKMIAEWNMISPSDKILVGVSGGADSVCLLTGLFVLAKEMDFSLEVVHVEHGIRGEESQKDADFVKELCKSLSLVCHEIKIDVPAYCKETGMGTEEGARKLRYESFQTLALEKNAKVALAHHMEDNAETILFHIIRGSSLAGFCGIQPVRQDEKGVIYIRPLLKVHRSEILKFLEEKNLMWCTDSTNMDLNYSRNYIRNIVIPSLEEINEQAISHINRSASALWEIKDYLEQERDKEYPYIVKQEGKGYLIDVEKLQLLHLALQKEIVYKAVTEVLGGKKDITSVHIMDILNLCENQSGREISLPESIIAKREYDQIYLGEKIEDFHSEREIRISSSDLQKCIESRSPLEIKLSDTGEKLILRILSRTAEMEEIPKKPYTKWLSYDKMKQGFCIRNRRSGDYFISDVLGHHKKLKQYFIDEKIPAREREGMWLLAQEDLVLWLIGGRISEHMKISKDTKIIVEIEYQGGN